MANRWGHSDTLHFGPQNPCRWWLPQEIKRLLLLWKTFDQPRQYIIKKIHYFTNKAPSSQSCGFSSSHVWMWELDYKESWTPENWCFWTLVLKKNFESPLDCKEIQRVHPKGNQFWIFGGRTDAEAETPILWPPDVKSCLIWKDPDAGKDWRWEEKGSTEDEMVGWHHQLNGHEFEKTHGSWWWTGRSGLLQPMGSQRVGHDWGTELNWASLLGKWMSHSTRTILGNTVFPPLHDLTTFVKNLLTLCVKVLLGSEFFSIDL